MDAESACPPIRQRNGADVRRRGGQLATLFDIRDVDLPSLTGDPLTLALADQAGRHGVADYIVQLIDDLPKEERTTQTGGRLSHASLIDLANDPSPEIGAEIMDLGRHMNRSLAHYDALLESLAETEAFQKGPGTLFHFLSQRIAELPPAALTLCRRWAERFARAAGDIANSEAADAYDVTEVILALYSHAQPGSMLRQGCLDVIDMLMEQRIGNVDQKADDAAYEPSR